MVNWLGKKRISAIIIAITIAGMATAMLSGCVVKTLPAVAQLENTEVSNEYNDNQMYLMLAGRKKEVADVYTDQILDVTVNELGDTYNDALDMMAKDYIEKQYVMSEMCEERGITLSNDEKIAIGRSADEYMERLESAGNVYEITKEEVERIKTDVALIGILRKKIVDESKIEVSKSDARVMDVVRIELDNTGNAYDAIREAQEEDSDIMAVARRYSINSEISLKVGKGDLPPALEEAVLNLEDGEVTPILTLDDKMYIFKCISGFDEEATEERRQKMTEERQNIAISQAYEMYVHDHPYSIDEEDWKQVLIMYNENPSVPDVFEEK